MQRHRSLVVLLAAAMLSSCGDKADGPTQIIGPAPGARIKFYNFGVNAPAVNFYANETKMTAVTSTTGVEATTGVAYSNVAAGGFYAAIAPGQYALTGRIAAATDKNLPIATVAANLEDGKFYSYYMSGFYNTSTKTVEAFLVEDPFVPEIDFSVAYVRFVHAISNANPMTLFVKDSVAGDSIAVGGAVAYKAAGAFTAVPGRVYNLTTRYTGSNTAVITRSAQSFLNGRVYTVSARGDITVVSTTATNRPFLDNTANR